MKFDLCSSEMKNGCAFNQEERWMSRALRLARKGEGFVSPNPTVGACVVKNGRLLAEGYHQRFGGPHAEVVALQKAGNRSKGAALFVTLEPCSTFSKTPPCVDAICNAGVKRVVFAMEDPNPAHRGRAVRLLKRKGIIVTAGVLKAQAEKQIEAYSKWITTKIPFVTLKMAQSVDGKIASRTGSSRWIAGPEARKWVHTLRASCDAILVGRNTVRVDNPRLTARNGRPVREPWRVILDPLGRTPLRANVFQAGGPILLACREKSFSHTAKKFRHTAVTVMPVSAKGHQLDLVQLVKRLGALGITSLLVEGGGEVAWSFIESRLVDKALWIIAPKIIGGRETITSVEGRGIASLSEAHGIRLTQIRSLGNDVLLEGYLR